MLYRDGQSALHRANPLTKWAVLPLLVTAASVWPPAVLIAFTCLVVGFAFASGVGLFVGRRIVIILGPLAFALFAVNGVLLARGEPVVAGAVTYYPEGIAHALRLFSRLALLVAGGLIVTATTRPADLAKALDQIGLSPAVSFLLTAPLLLIDGVAQEAGATRDSLRVRGLATSRGVGAKLRIVWFAVTSVARGLLTTAGTRAFSLDGRGFRSLPRRTIFDPLRDTPGQARLRGLLLGLAALHILAVFA